MLKKSTCFYHEFSYKQILFNQFFKNISFKLIPVLYDVNFILIIFYNFKAKLEVSQHFINHRLRFWPFKVNISDSRPQNP